MVQCLSEVEVKEFFLYTDSVSLKINIYFGPFTSRGQEENTD